MGLARAAEKFSVFWWVLAESPFLNGRVNPLKCLRLNMLSRHCGGWPPESSVRLFLQINEQTDGWMRVQLARVFRKYASPETPVEMLKKKTQAGQICREFGKGFRPIQKVQAAFLTRPVPDEALCAVLWEYKDRGKKGYDLTERFFAIFRSNFPDLIIKARNGPAGTS
jgi:hypothetical protein